MNTLLALILFAVLLNGLLYLPLFFRLRLVRRERALQDARVEIAACATEFQSHLANKCVVCGDLVHDVHYEAMNAAQFFDNYLAIMPLVGRKRHIISELRHRVKQELDSLPPEL